jgi:tetratricopeptide (TPR) repeat protein
MKSERRHELEHNALADWMTGFVTSVKPYANLILVVILVFALGLLAYTMWTRSARAEAAEAWEQMLASISGGKARDLELTAEAHPNSQVGFLARTLAGDLRLAEGSNLVFESKSQANQELEKAIDDYLAVIEKCNIPEILARARYGLGRAYEGLGDLEKAREAYKGVFQNQPDGVFADLARDRFEDLGRPGTKEFYGRLAIYKPKPEDSPGEDAPGTPGEKPSFSLEDLPELGGPATATDDTPLFSPQMKIDGSTLLQESPTPDESDAPTEPAEPAADTESGKEPNPEENSEPSTTDGVK